MEKLAEDNAAAITVAISVVETLKQTEAVNEFLVTLATETNISELPTDRLLLYLRKPELFEQAWRQPTVMRRILDAVKSGTAEKVMPFRDALDAATKLTSGRKRGPNKAEVKLRFEETREAMLPVAKRLRSNKDCRNPRNFLLELEGSDNPLAKRIRNEGLADTWFPPSRSDLPHRLRTDEMTALLLSREGLGAASTSLRTWKSAD